MHCGAKNVWKQNFPLGGPGIDLGAFSHIPYERYFCFTCGLIAQFVTDEYLANASKIDKLKRKFVAIG